MIVQVPAPGLVRGARGAAGPRSLRRALFMLAFVAAVAVAVTISLAIEAFPETGWLVGSYALVALADIAVGLVAWARRPSNNVGALLCVTGLLTICSALWNTSNPAVTFVGGCLREAPIAAILHLVLAFPSGRLPDRRSKALIVAGYLITVGLEVPQQLFRADSPLPSLVNADLAADVDHLQTTLGSITLLLASMLMFGRLRSHRNTSAQRRVLAGVYAYGLGTLLLLPIAAIVLRNILGLSVETLFAVQLVDLAGLPFVFAAGVFRGGFARTGEIEELGTWLGAWLGAPDGRRQLLRDALAEALGDPSVSLLFRRSGTSDYIDADGVTRRTPPDDGERAGIEIEGQDGPVAMIVYDTSLIASPTLVRSAGNVVLLAIDRERLNAELIASREAVRRSRARIVEAADAERRRVALDLHDLLQNRLILATMRAGILAANPDSASSGREEARRLQIDLDATITELRGLVQGVMPPLLTERGLYPAVQELTDRLPIPVTLLLDEERELPPVIAAAGYFILAEALSNVVKHAGATKVEVQLSSADGVLVLGVQDDGAGGAVAGRGSGLRGMGDRVDAHEGRLTIVSPAGDGTHISVELPCAW